jgi:hypothetical protein
MVLGMEILLSRALDLTSARILTASHSDSLHREFRNPRERHFWHCRREFLSLAHQRDGKQWETTDEANSLALASISTSH